VVEHPVADTLGLAQHPLLAKPEALGDRAAARVADGRLDRDPVEQPRAERVVDVGPDGGGHDAAPLVVAREPVADARLAVGPVDPVDADHPDDAPVGIDDRRLQPVVVGELLAGRPDERQDVLRLVLAADPRHPCAEVLAVGVDHREELVRVGLLEQAQRVPARQLVAEHQTLASKASSAS